MAAPLHEARFYRKLEDNRVQCLLCPQGCTIAPGKTGICLARENHDGTLIAASYGQATSVAMDPIEKKPLYHFHPGADILSIGSWGCNFKCAFCQNWGISQQRAPSDYVPPPDAVKLAKQHRSIGISYTYNEPLVSYEYVYDTSKLAREAGLVNVLVTNGSINPGPLAELLPLIDALNIDIKSIREDFYRRLCHARLQPVLDTCIAARKACHVEVTNLVIPGQNDSEQDLTDLADWIAANLGREMPVHLSAYFPRYQMRERPTPPETLNMAYGIFKQQLDFVYIGNVVASHGSNTTCKSCGQLLIERHGYSVRVLGLRGSTCSKCGAANNIIV
jgi:pyruvate formate lyase activating enzyme